MWRGSGLLYMVPDVLRFGAVLGVQMWRGLGASNSWSPICEKNMRVNIILGKSGALMKFFK